MPTDNAIRPGSVPDLAYASRARCQIYQAAKPDGAATNNGSSTGRLKYAGKQRDPFVGVPALPLSLNRYAYAGNNPVSATDPSGLSSSQVLNPNALNCFDIANYFRCPAGTYVQTAFGPLYVPSPRDVASLAAALAAMTGGTSGGGRQQLDFGPPPVVPARFKRGLIDFANASVGPTEQQSHR